MESFIYNIAQFLDQNIIYEKRKRRDIVEGPRCQNTASFMLFSSANGMLKVFTVLLKNGNK